MLGIARQDETFVVGVHDLAASHVVGLQRLLGWSASVGRSRREV